MRHVELYPSDTTILVGENNTGKSNILHALRLLFDPLATRLASEVSEEDINDAARANKERSFSITVEIGDLQKHQELEAIFMQRIDRDGDETFVTVQGKFEEDDENVYSWNVQVLSPKGRNNEPIPFASRMARYVPLHFLDAVRDPAREIRATGRGTLARLLSDVTLEDVEDEVMANIRKANEALSKNQDINDIAANIANLLVPYIPGGKGDVSFSVATEDPSQLVKGFRLNLERLSDLRPYDLSRHGTGLQNLVVMAIFRSMLSIGGGICPILGIEEPESHLHPQAQRCVFKDIEKVPGPVLLTTHSPGIAECSSPLSIIRLTSDSRNEVNSHQIQRSSITDSDLRLLSRMMRAGRANALFARALIIVEGPSEVNVLPAIAENMGFNLDRDGISVVPADGNSFSYILKACSEEHFSIPTVVTFDADALSGDNGLLNEAFKAGLIDKETRDAGRTSSPEDRQATLEGVGWIPAVRNFEEEIARAGCLQLMLDFIDSLGNSQSLENFLKAEGLPKDAHGVSRYLNENRTGKGLKVPVSREVADNIEEMASIPQCFSDAIKTAVDLATAN